MSPNSHSTDSLTELILALYSCIWGVKTAFLNGFWSCTLCGYAGSPYKHIRWPWGETAWCWRSCSRPDSANIAASCLLPSENERFRKQLDAWTMVVTLWCILSREPDGNLSSLQKNSFNILICKIISLKRSITST